MSKKTLKTISKPRNLSPAHSMNNENVSPTTSYLLTQRYSVLSLIHDQGPKTIKNISEKGFPTIKSCKALGNVCKPWFSLYYKYSIVYHRIHGKLVNYICTCCYLVLMQPMRASNYTKQATPLTQNHQKTYRICNKSQSLVSWFLQI